MMKQEKSKKDGKKNDCFTVSCNTPGARTVRDDRKTARDYNVECVIEFRYEYGVTEE